MASKPAPRTLLPAWATTQLNTHCTLLVHTHRGHPCPTAFANLLCVAHLFDQLSLLVRVARTVESRDPANRSPRGACRACPAAVHELKRALPQPPSAQGDSYSPS